MEELQFGAYRLWKTIGRSKETRGRPAFIRFQEEIGEDCFGQKFTGGEQSSSLEVVVVSHYLRAVVSTLLLR